MKPPKATEQGATLAYLRMSTDKQDLDRQNETVETIRTKFGWRVEVIEDEAEDSDILLEHRPGGKRLLERIRRGGVERVWVSEIDRLGRGLYVLSCAVHEIEKYPNPPVIEEGLNRQRCSLLGGDSAFTGMRFGQTGDEKFKIKKRTGEGSRTKAKDAYHWMGGPAPYGYNVRRDAAAISPSKTAHLVKSTESTTGNARFKSRVAVVQHMYKMIADGASCRDVCDLLNKLRVPPQQRKRSPAKRWMPGRVRNIILNELYMGMHYYGRRKIYRDPDDPRHKAHARAATEPAIPRPVPDLAIVDEKLWHRAIAAMKLNNSALKSGVKNAYLLNGGLIHCQCGGSFSASLAHKKDIWYRCTGRKSDAYRGSGRPQCTVAAIKGPRLEKAVWEGVRELIMNPGATLRQLDEQNVAREGLDYSVADEIRDRDADQAKAIERRTELDDLLREANDDVQHVQKDIDGLRAQEAEAKIHVAVRATAQGRLAELKKQLLAGKLTFDARREIVRAVVSGIYIAPTGAIKIKCSFVPNYERYSQRSPNDDTVTLSCRPPGWSTITW
ncbi:MAG: recombinase family protein [Candidatus Solibacter sp.]|nr:recombinase family protein [Candidatus Solibacter sp.]